MPIRLIAVDLDGTLLNDAKVPPPDFVQAAEKLLAHGIRIVLASGRQYFNIRSQFPALADRFSYISENGALVFEGGENIYCRELDAEGIREIFDAAREIPTATPFLCGAKCSYWGEADELARANIFRYCTRRKHVDDPVSVGTAKDKIVKIAIFDRESAEKNCAGLSARFRSRYMAQFSGVEWLDVMSRGTNKGVALEFLLACHGISPADCMAFGDYPNDSEMLAVAGYGYAMENAHAEVKKAARYLAPSNNERGVMTVLRRHFDFL